VPFGLAFLLPWFDWGEWRPWQYLASQFAFDGCLTFVLLAQCGLFAELEDSQRGRVWLLVAQAIASLAGVSVSYQAVAAVAGSEGTSEGINCDGMPELRASAAVLAPIAMACFAATALLVLAQTHKSASSHANQAQGPAVAARLSPGSGPSLQRQSLGI